MPLQMQTTAAADPDATAAFEALRLWVRSEPHVAPPTIAVPVARSMWQRCDLENHNRVRRGQNVTVRPNPSQSDMATVAAHPIFHVRYLPCCP
jgi:hypothetical protein